MVAFVLSLMLHTLAAVVWVGGLFFVHFSLLPSLKGLDAPERYGIIARVVPTYLRWVWVSILALLGTGYGVLLLGYRGGIGGGGLHIDLMQITGVSMITLFVYMDFFPWRHFLGAYKDAEFDKAEHYLDSVRSLVRIILVLGLITSAVGATGSLWAD